VVENAEVRIRSEVSLNRREPRLLVDPSVDLASEERRPTPAYWILPLEEPLWGEGGPPSTGSGEVVSLLGGFRWGEKPREEADDELRSEEIRSEVEAPRRSRSSKSSGASGRSSPSSGLAPGAGRMAQR